MGRFRNKFVGSVGSMLELSDGDFSASVVLRALVVSGRVKAAQQAIDKAMAPKKQRLRRPK
jgi:hypothetical protein